MIERFRDEIGDWRVCVLSPFGGRVHAAWGLALSARIREVYGLESDAIWSDDGIIVHLPDADEAPGEELVMIEPDELEDLVVGELGGCALFGARFRENAGRALLIPRAYPGRRTPLWQQRLKSQSLLEVARRYAQFPIVLETYREVLRDVLDLPGLHDLLTKLHRRELSLVEVETQTASPFASSLLFDYVATYMYEGDQPNAERRAAALALDRELLRELLGQEELRELIDPGALETVEADLQRLSERTRADSVDALHDVLRRVGDLTLDEAEAARRRRRRGWSSCAASGGRSSCASAARSAGSRPRTRASTATRWAPSRRPGCPRRSSPTCPDAMERLVRRYARTHGPFETRALRDALRARPDARAGAAGAVRAPGARRAAARAGRRASGATPRSCGGCGARRWPRCGPRSSPPTSAPSPASRPPGRASTATRRPAPGIDRLREVLVPLQGLPLPLEVWERDVLPRRTGAYSPAWMDQLCASGEIVWVGAGALGRRSGRVALYFRDDAPLIGPPPRGGEEPSEPVHLAVRERLQAGPCFFTDLLTDVAGFTTEELQNGLWDLVWAGEATNDAFAPLRSPKLTATPAWSQRARAVAAARSGRGGAAASPRSRAAGR